MTIVRSVLVAACLLWGAGLGPAAHAQRMALRTSPVQPADTYLRALAPGDVPAERARAVRAYRRVLRQTGPDLSAPDQAVVRRHVAQLAPLLPTATLRRVLREAPDAPPETWTFREGAGGALLAWWRRQDPVPATPENERLEEHLQRLAFARAHYAEAERFDGLDDRGRIYVRFGPPWKEHSIRYNDGTFIREVFRFGVAVTAADFPDNELWLYPGINDAAYFLFVEKRRDRFRIAEATEDLLPSTLRRARATNERGLNIAVSALAAMEYIYRDLALYHPDFSSRYEEIANYVSWQESQRIMARMGGGSGAQQSMQVGAGVGQTRRVFWNPNFGIEPPNRVVTSVLSRSRQEDWQAARRRREVLPRQHTDVMEAAELLDVAVRTARFLLPDGTTRAELYWGTTTAAARPPDEDARRPTLVHLTAVPYRAGYRRGEVVERWYDLGPAAGTAEGLVVPPALALPLVTDTMHLALQWEQHLATRPRGQVQLGRRVRFTAARVDTLRALRTAADQLEMSDLKVLALPDSAAADLEAAVPYPFHYLPQEKPLLLYFELYHLAFAADDRTRYTVAYDVERRTRRGGLARLFGRDGKVERTSTSAAYQGESRRTEEYIRLDLSAADRREGTLRITVRVVDEATGQQVKRELRFETEAVE